MALGSRVMDRLAQLYEEDKSKNKYTAEATTFADFNELLRLHWSKEKKAFFDYGRHSDKVKLIRKPIKGVPDQFLVERSVVNKPRVGFVDDVFGYNSLFPLMLRLVPHESEQMGHILDKLVDPEEYHLDLRCWMALGSRVMDRLAQLYEEDKSKTSTRLKPQLLPTLMNSCVFTGAFFDYGRHSDKVKLIRKPIKGVPDQFLVERSVVNKPRVGFVDDVFGYNSLFPLMLRLVPHESEQMGHILDKLVDPELLWTNYGLRSVARSSPYYAARNTEHDPPYWRGYIWVNANYMVLSALKHYASLPGPHQDKSQSTFTALRQNLVVNMARVCFLLFVSVVCSIS
ncbi:hypothetical protein OESDEN_01644 [Oesophagostomum dentatum]|uniref:mannosyl-oligosaccharide glucosidase n=1 Tax=Oesophagostomum dentatum TaxID=61180 RepID=A0A0B1TQI2_OESDE|nr:hypothetical protein OESDEN_01644 [Oesophagostomum dentatum]